MMPEFHITVGNKEYLFLLLAIPFIVMLHLYFLRHSKKRALKFGNFTAMSRVLGAEKSLSKNFTSLFFFLLIFMLLVALLMNVSLWFVSDISSSDYFILLDSGASMNARDVYPDRYTVAKSIAKEMVDGLGNARFGFISFGGSIIDSSPLTDDKILLLEKMDAAKISNTGTDMALAISTAAESLKASNRSKVIILISDGHDTVGMPLSDVIPIVLEEHIKIFSIGVGTLEGGNFLDVPFTENLVSKLNEDNLRLLSNISDSGYIRVDENYDIAKVISDVKSDASKGYVKFDLDNLFLIAILLVLFTNWVLENTRFRVFP